MSTRNWGTAGPPWAQRPCGSAPSAGARSESRRPRATAQRGRPSLDANSLLELVLGKGVEESAQNGDGAARDAEGGHRGPKHDNGGDDDHHALHGVGDRVRHGVELAQRQKGDLVVHVVEEPAVDHVEEELGATCSIRNLETLHHASGSLNCEADRDEHESRHDGEDSVNVRRVHVLANVASAHDLLAVDSACGGAEVRSHRGPEAEPVERQLGGARKADAPDDRQQGGVDLPRHHLTHEEEVQEGGHHGLRGLDDVAEGHGTREEGNDRSDVGGQVAEGGG
mmetsp:Transcript_45657/g.136463  ORF Transcript_45657/g.136463 Transcript_45657/m.136463 type:complete len:282 (+) Transcript_45657:53-898(+)